MREDPARMERRIAEQRRQIDAALAAIAADADARRRLPELVVQAAWSAAHAVAVRVADVAADIAQHLGGAIHSVATQLRDVVDSQVLAPLAMLPAAVALALVRRA